MSESALIAIEPELTLSPELPKIALAAQRAGLMAFVIQPVIGSRDTPHRTRPKESMPLGSSNVRVTGRPLIRICRTGSSAAIQRGTKISTLTGLFEVPSMGWHIVQSEDKANGELEDEDVSGMDLQAICRPSVSST